MCLSETRAEITSAPQVPVKPRHSPFSSELHPSIALTCINSINSSRSNWQGGEQYAHKIGQKGIARERGQQQTDGWPVGKRL